MDRRWLSISMVLSGAVLLAAASGCAHRATLLVWEPAAVDVTGLERLAVLEFRGPDESGAIARDAVLAQLRTNGYYELVDAEALQDRREPAGETWSETALDPMADTLAAARRAEVDAILVGNVLRYQATDEPAGNTGFHLDEVAERGGRWASSILRTSFSGNEATRRHTTVSLAFQLVDVRSGRVLAARHSSHSAAGRLRAGQAAAATAQPATGDSVHRCAQDIVEMIAPHQVPVEVPLASVRWGRAARWIRRGNLAAARGQWSKAELHWRMALEIDPESHAALYNLGLAHEARYDFEKAEELFARASAAKHHPVYSHALHRVKRSREDYRIAMAQRDRRLLPELDPEPIYAALNTGRRAGAGSPDPPAMLLGPASPLP